MASPGASAAILLAKQLKRMGKEDHIDGISVGLADNDNVFEWEVMLMLADDIPYYGGQLDREPPSISTNVLQEASSRRG
jgi:ubiquitin-conjugating enzyme E2 G1